MKFIFSYVRKYWYLVLLTLVIKGSSTLTELLLPYVLEHMIDTIAPRKELKLIVFWGSAMLFLALAVRTLSVLSNRLAVSTSKKCIYEIRKDLFEKTARLSGNQVDEIGLPSLISRMTSDSYNLQSFIRGFQTIGIRAPLMLVGGIVVTMTMDRGLASILFVLTPIMLFMILFISQHGIPLYTKVQKKLDDVVLIMRENITGIRVIRSLGKETHEKNRYAKANKAMAREDVKASLVMALPGPLLKLSMNMGLTLVVLVGALRVKAGKIEPGVILAFLTYFQMILMGIMAINRFFLMLSKANASANRIEEVIKLPDVLEISSDSEVQDTDDCIVFDDVSFSYGKTESHNKKDFAGGEREKTLSSISFSIRKGGSLGIIGPTGSGKTTIINLLMRFYDTDSGRILVDGRNIRSYELSELRQKFGTVFQNDMIFADSLTQNIAFGRAVNDAEIRDAAASAMAQSFIDEYPEGFQHRTAIHGADLSGGQKQRILISRALAAHPEILILDDSSSALDYRTDAQLRKNIHRSYGDSTLVVVAQRISSVMNLDQILVLDEGRIIQMGSHEELMKSCEMYQQIYSSQMGAI